MKLLQIHNPEHGGGDATRRPEGVAEHRVQGDAAVLDARGGPVHFGGGQGPQAHRRKLRLGRHAECHREQTDALAVSHWNAG